jgi:hypothetical protein
MNASRLKKVLVVVCLAFTLASCQLLYHGEGDPTHLTLLTGRPTVTAPNLGQILLVNLQADHLWTDANHSTPLDLSTLISVPNQTISSITNGGSVVVYLASPLVQGTSQLVVFDTTKTFYGTSGSQPTTQFYKYQFSNPTAQVQYY